MWQYNYNNAEYLQHYGILGMRWGIRRFQDKSGRLTAAGKKRYDDDLSNGSPEKTSSKTSKEVGDSFIEKKLEIRNSFDYDDIFVFIMVPKGYDEETDGAMLDNFYSVDKNTGEVSGFAPWSDQGFIDRFSGGD